MCKGLKREIFAYLRKYARWRKNEIWQEFEQELIAAHKALLLEAHRSEATLESRS